MKNVTLIAIILSAILGSIAAMAQEHNKFYGSMSSDSDKRHQINFGYRINKTFSVEGSYNQMESDGGHIRSHHQTGDWNTVRPPLTGIGGGDGSWGGSIIPGRPVGDCPGGISGIGCVNGGLDPSSDPGNYSTRQHQEVDKSQAVMLWGKAQYDWNQHLTTYAKVGVGRFKMDIDTYGTSDQGANSDYGVINDRSHYSNGYGFAAGVEIAMTDSLYTTVEYQHLKADKMAGVDHSEGGATIGIGYKF